MTAGCTDGIGHVAPIFTGIVRFVFLAVLEVCSERPTYQQHADDAARDDERKREHAVAVSPDPPTPAPLSSPHRDAGWSLKASAASPDRFVSQSTGKHDTRLGILTGSHRWNRVNDGPVGVDDQRAVERSVGPMRARCRPEQPRFPGVRARQASASRPMRSPPIGSRYSASSLRPHLEMPAHR